MKVSTKLTKVDCDLFIKAKDLLQRGCSQASVQRLLHIGEKTVRKIARSTVMSDYCRQVEEERIKKVARRDAINRLEKIMDESKYDWRGDCAGKSRVMVSRRREVLGWPIIVLALVGVAAVVIAALIILINLIVRNEVL